MTFRLRIFFTLLLFLSLIFSLILQLNRSLVNKTYEKLAETRFLFVSQSLKTALELNIGLGFPLAELRVSQDLIERDAIVIGMLIVNDFDRTVGYVALEYAKTYFDQRFDEFSDSLNLWALGYLPF
jgi:hypothetical protein